MNKKLAGMLAMIAVVSVFAVNAQAANVYIYSESFGGASATNLHGTAPDTRPADETWTAATAWKADGSITSAGDSSAFLPFVPEAGNIYTLSATLAQPIGGSWGAIGFMDYNNTGRFHVDGNNPSPWMLWRADGEIVAFSGPGVSGESFVLSTNTGTKTLSIVLNTEDTAWTAEWFIDAVSLETYTFSGTPTITHVGVGRDGGAAVDFDSLNLEVAVAPDEIIWSDLSTTNITENAAWASATINTNLDVAVLVWDTTDHTPGTTNDWPNRVSLAPQSAGAVTTQMTSLAAGTAYFWRFYGANAETNGWSEVTEFATAFSVAQTPVFTNATALSASSIQLGWEDNALDETGYILQRSTTAGSGYATISSLAQNVTTYEDSGLTAGTTYYYQLAATNSVNGSTTAFADCRTSATTTQASWGSATGGTMYEESIDGTKWQIHVFTNIGTHTNGLVVTKPGDFEYLIVAGGGGGGGAKGGNGAGGGGAGGLLTGIVDLSSDAYDVTVGAGGAGATASNVRGENGGNSSAFGFESVGGGAGGCSGSRAGLDGGSGGGGSVDGSGGSGTAGQGYAGATPTDNGTGGGGGGAGGAGVPLDGGAGLSLAFAGPEEVTYAKGGDGGSSTVDNAYYGADGIENTGQGGGGSYWEWSGSTGDGGAGGSGIVIVRYQIPPAGTVLIVR